LSTFTVCLPAFLLIIFISYSYTRFKNNFYFKAILSGIRPGRQRLTAHLRVACARPPTCSTCAHATARSRVLRTARRRGRALPRDAPACVPLRRAQPDG